MNAGEYIIGRLVNLTHSVEAAAAHDQVRFYRSVFV